MKRRLLIGWTALLASIVAPALAQAQTCPTGRVNIIVPFPTGAEIDRWGKIIRGANIKLD